MHDVILGPGEGQPPDPAGRYWYVVSQFENVSVPGPPMQTSVPAPPLIASLPAPPTMQSLRLAPLMVSTAALPRIRLALPFGSLIAPEPVRMRANVMPAHSDGFTLFTAIAWATSSARLEATVFVAVTAMPATRDEHDHGAGKPHAAERSTAARPRLHRPRAGNAAPKETPVDGAVNR